MSFLQLLNLIRDGESVRSSVINRPLTELDRNLRHVREVLIAAEIGSTVFARERLVAADSVQGQPVYYDENTGVFQPAMAVVDTTSEPGKVRPAESAMPWGVIHKKHSANSADILLVGCSSLDISSAVTGPVEAGIYYLSGVTPGLLVRNPPGIRVPVLRATADGQVFVLPSWVDPSQQHEHFLFDLATLPADSNYTPPENPLTSVAITSPDESLAGWLPADHPTFNGNAPAGAKFGYNFQAEEATHLDAAWPPLPARQAYVEYHPASSGSGGGFSGVPENLVTVDRNGIWWMSDCFADVPWNTENPAIYSTWDGTCPRTSPAAMRIWFSRPSYLSDTTVVTSLTSNDDRLRVRCQGKDRSASVGALEISLNTEFLLGSTGVIGSQVFKEFDELTGRFNSGEVVEGVISTGNTLQITSTSSRPLNDSNSAPTVHQGLIEIRNVAELRRELPVSRVRLDGVSEETLLDVLYLGFPSGRQSSYRASVHIPNTLNIPEARIRFNFWLLGRVAGSLPNLTLTARRLPTAGGNPQTLPSTDVSVAIATNLSHDTENQYTLATSEPLVVAAGDSYLFTLSRNSGDGYDGEVGVLRQFASIDSAGG